MGEINVSVNSTNSSRLFQAFLDFQFCTPPSAAFSSSFVCYHFSVLVERPIVALDGGEHEREKKNKGCSYI